MRGWTQEHIDKLSLRKPAKIVEIKPIRLPRPEPKPLTEMKRLLKYMEVDFVTEHKFLENRKFRFDIAIPEKKIAIEYEGLMSAKSRHTTLTGYSNDTIKYNLAVLNGWKVLRYTQLTYQTFLWDISQLL